MIAKAALAQFDDAEVIRHFWPMVRSLQHLDRIVEDLAANPGVVFESTFPTPRRNPRAERSAVLRTSANPSAAGSLNTGNRDERSGVPS